MTRTRKTVIALLAAVCLVVSMLAMVACGGNKAIRGIEITEAPTKTDYVAGETFNPDGMVVSLVYDDESKAAITDYTYAPNGALKTSDRTITITYKTDSGEYSVKQLITVHNNVVEGEIKSNPTKTNYILGEKFDPTGMVVSVVYENGETDNNVEITSDNATFKTAALTEEDAEFVITYKEFQFKVALTFIEGVYIEAEDGIMTGAAKIQTDAVKNDSLQGEWDDRYLASGGAYVSDVGAGDKFTFVFNASKDGTGSIAIRLSGKYLREDAEWIPIWMDDCQFNKLCKLYVNHVEYAIPDTVILPGGGEAGGEPNFYLWFNWQEVPFDNIAFQEGVNLITLEFLRHDYICSQSSFNNIFGANIDSLIVTAYGDCKVTPYTGSLDDIETELPAAVTYAATAASIVAENDKAVVVVNGTYETTEELTDAEVIAFIKEIMLDFQGNPHMQAYYETGNTGEWNGDWGFNPFLAFDVTLGADGTFTAKYDVTTLRAFCYTGHYGGTSADFDFKPPMDEYSNSVTVGGKTYTLSYVPGGGNEQFYGCVGMRVQDSNSYKTTGATLEAKNGKPYLVITGTYEGYTKVELEAVLASANIYADVLNIPDYSVNGDWTEVAVLTKGETLLIEVAENGTFKLCLDLSGDVANGWALFAHFSFTGATGDNFTSNNVDLTASITVGGFTYTFEDTTNTGDWKTNLVVVKVTAA